MPRLACGGRGVSGGLFTGVVVMVVNGGEERRRYACSGHGRCGVVGIRVGTAGFQGRPSVMSAAESVMSAGWTPSCSHAKGDRGDPAVNPMNKPPGVMGSWSACRLGDEPRLCVPVEHRSCADFHDHVVYCSYGWGMVGAKFEMYHRCQGVSAARGWYVLRMNFSALAGSIPSSIAMQASAVPVRPTPPRHAMSTRECAALLRVSCNAWRASSLLTGRQKSGHLIQ